MPVKAQARPTHHHAASSLSGMHMIGALHIVCTHCDAINRVPRERLRQGGKCGSCHLPLYEGAAGRIEQRRSLRQACEAQRYPAAGRFLGNLVRSLPRDGADFRAGSNRA
jgi:thioredoxin 2